MDTIRVEASKPYDIAIGAALLDQSGSLIRAAAGGATAAIITDDNVDRLYGDRLEAALLAHGYHTVKYTIPHGESSKYAGTYLSVLEFLAEEKLSRTDIVIAFGGGVVGDLAGFSAATYMRGIPYIQIPTTLLAAVDSSVGGKTGINLEAGKNLAGAFYQPKLVLCDPSLLSTISPEVYRDGCAEVIKYGMIADKALFDSLIMPVRDQLENIITGCIKIKRDIVAKDEFEGGLRKILNFGHTVGHAIELLSDYSVSHGHAIAVGMSVVTRASVKMGICKDNCLENLLRMLHHYRLPERLQDVLPNRHPDAISNESSDSFQFGAAELAGACLSDKKRDGDTLTMIFPVETGKCVLKKIPAAEVENIIRMGLA